MKSPAFQFYARDFLTDERCVCMNMSERGLYITLLSHAWLEGSIPGEAVTIARLVRESEKEIAKPWAAVKACFTDRGDGRLINSKLEAIRAEQEAYREARSRGGKAGMSKRNQLANSEVNLVATQAQVIHKLITDEHLTKSNPAPATETATASASTDSLRESADGEANAIFAAPPLPSGLRAMLPESIDELKRVAVHFLADFGNVTAPEALGKHGPAYVDVLAALRGRGLSTADAWRAFADARMANNGRPLFGATAKKAMNYAIASPKPNLRAVAPTMHRGFMPDAEGIWHPFSGPVRPVGWADSPPADAPLSDEPYVAVRA